MQRSLAGDYADHIPRQDLSSLSDTHREILEMVTRGMTNEEIAGKLKVSVNTVKTHISRLFDRLGARDRTHLAVLMLESQHLERLGVTELIARINVLNDKIDDVMALRPVLKQIASDLSVFRNATNGTDRA